MPDGWGRMKKTGTGCIHYLPFPLPLENSCRAGNTGVASLQHPHRENWQRGLAMKDYVLNKKPKPASNEMVWAFDLGHPLRLECCPSLAGAGAALRPSDGRRWRSRMRVKTGPGEGRWGKAFLGGGTEVRCRILTTKKLR